MVVVPWVVALSIQVVGVSCLGVVAYQEAYPGVQALVLTVRMGAVGAYLLVETWEVLEEVAYL